jgi:hypothetical protein
MELPQAYQLNHKLLERFFSQIVTDTLFQTMAFSKALICNEFELAMLPVLFLRNYDV